MSPSHDYQLWRTDILAAAHRAGVVLRQAAVSRYGDAHIRTQLAARRWQAPSCRVLVLHNGPLTEMQRMWVALLVAPPGSMLHGLSAATLDGFEGFDPDGLAIVIAASSRSQRRGRIDLPAAWNVRVRWSGRLGSEDVSRAALPPRTRLPRSIVDAASERGPERRARAIVIAAAQQRLVRPATLWDALSRRGRCRNRAIIAESIVDVTGGIESLPEREFAAICRTIGVPEPARQRILETSAGTFCLDDDWPIWGVRSEIHGLPHRNIVGWDQDLLRQNEIAIAGGGLLIFSSYAVRRQPERVGEQLRRMFEAQGWRPGLTMRQVRRPSHANVGR